MSKESQLRNQIQTLTNEIAQIQQENTKFRQLSQQTMNDTFQQMQQEHQRQMKRLKRESNEAYTQRLTSFQEKESQIIQQQMQQLQAQAQQLMDLQNEKIKELKQCNEQLQDLLQNMKDHCDQVNQRHQQMALDLFHQIEEHRTAVDQTPHTFFFEGQFEIIDSHVNQIDEEIKTEMYQAAASDASSVMMEFDLLKVKVEEELYVWMLAYDDFQRIVLEMKKKIERLEADSIETCLGQFHMVERELDFWSSQTYGAFKKKLQTSVEMIESIEKNGIYEFLSNQDGRNRKKIFGMVNQAKKDNDELIAIMNCILSERILSDERYKVARNIQLLFEKNGYTMVQKGFRQNNPKDCYDIVCTIQGLDYVHITIVPVRKYGRSVKNEIIVMCIPHSLQDTTIQNELLETYVSRIQSMNSELKVMSESKENVIQVVNQKRKMANPVEQIRHLEKKYQN